MCATCRKHFGGSSGQVIQEQMNKKGVTCVRCGKEYCIECVMQTVYAWKVQFECKCGNDEMIPTEEGSFFLSRLMVPQVNLQTGQKFSVPGVLFQGSPHPAANEKKTADQAYVQFRGDSNHRRAHMITALGSLGSGEQGFDMLMWRLANAFWDGENQDVVLDYLFAKILKGQVSKEMLVGMVEDAVQELNSRPDYLKPEFTNLSRYEK
jgi:hypothetical protein